MKKIRWGIVGPGEIANKFAKAIKNVKEASLVAVASRSEDKGKAFAEKYDIEKVFCGYEAMAESDAVDAVYIATPHPFHKPCAELFLNFGKHVLCEKPICVNAKEAEALSICAGKNNVFLMEAMWTRFIPSIINKYLAEKSISGWKQFFKSSIYNSSASESFLPNMSLNIDASSSISSFCFLT